MIYDSARWHDEAHTKVIGTDINGNIEIVPYDHTVFRLPEHGPKGFENSGGVIGEYEAPEPIPDSPHLNHGGLVRFTGVAPSTVLEGIRMIGATRVAKGRYRAAHEIQMPSDQYTAIVSVLDTRVLVARVTARTADYIEVRVTDLAGVAQDPAEVMLKTERVIYP